MAQVKDLSNLDFNYLRKQLKTYLSEQSEFVDYDFEGAGISVLLDLLAHNTHYNALLAHLNMNETFLDTAQNRASVVSHANLIGYVPRSKTAARTWIDVTVVGNDQSPPTLTLRRGTKFSGKINNTEYAFVVLTSIAAPRLAGNTYKFYAIEVKEGKVREEKYRVDSYDDFPRYEIMSDTIDTDTMRVRVYANPNTAEYDEYSKYDNISDIRESSQIYYVRENTFGRYEFHFGDDYLGKKPAEGSHIVCDFLETNGPEANNIPFLAPLDSIEGLTNITVTNTYTGVASGGQERETIGSIKYNAPINFGIQNRAVTALDYRNLLMQKFPTFKDVAIWGGEDADPPQYGKVFIAPALWTGYKLTESDVSGVDQYLKNKNIGAITTEVVNAEYNYVEITVNFMYSLRDTTKTAAELETIVKETVFAYNEEVLNTFEGILRYSKLLAKIDAADPGIQSSVINSRIYKVIDPNPLTPTDYVIGYPCEIYKTLDVDYVVTSSSFYIDNELAFIADEPMDDGTYNRRLKFMDAATGLVLTKYKDIGWVDVVKGKVYIENIRFDNTNPISIYVKPNTYDVAPKYNQIVRINQNDIIANGKLDTVAEYNIAGLSGYATFKRHE
jgi:hypothetical protein